MLYSRVLANFRALNVLKAFNSSLAWSSSSAGRAKGGQRFGGNLISRNSEEVTSSHLRPLQYCHSKSC